MNERLERDLARYRADQKELEYQAFVRDLRELANREPHTYHKLVDDLIPPETQARWAREEGRRLTFLWLSFFGGIVLLFIANTWPDSMDPNDPQTGQFMILMLGFLSLFAWLCVLVSGVDHTQKFHREIFRRYEARNRKETSP